MYHKIQSYINFLIKLFLVVYFLAIFLEIYFPNLVSGYFNLNILLLLIGILLIFEIYKKNSQC